MDFFNRAGKLGAKCFVSDGGSDPEFIKNLKFREYVNLNVLPKEASQADSWKDAMARAQADVNMNNFLLTVPEKNQLLDEKNLTRLTGELKAGTADLVVASREGLGDKESRLSNSIPSGSYIKSPRTWP